MAETKQSGGKSGSARTRKGSANSKASTRSTKSKASTRSGSGTKRRSSNTSKRSSSSSPRSSSNRPTPASQNGRRSDSGVTGTIKQVARPAVAVGAAAAGIAGGLALKSRMRRKTVLGVPVPRSLTKGISGLDTKSVAKSVGQASKQFAKTTKNVSKDLERAGDQAERLGKILD